MTAVGRALVLGGGGLTGIAWELGVLAGLRDSGADLTGADLIVGTSAGSFVGALVATGVDLDVAAALLSEIEVDLPPALSLATLAEGVALLSDNTVPPARARQRIGELARRAPVGDPAGHVARFADAMPISAWPTRPRLVVTTVDTATGELATWDAGTGVPLAEAVAASCALPAIFPPVDVGGTGYHMDGGVRSIANADLAAGAEAVVVIAPSHGLFRASPAEQVAALALDRSLLVTPDAASLAAIGSDMLDPQRRGPALAAGAAQGRTMAAQVRRIWPARVPESP